MSLEARVHGLLAEGQYSEAASATIRQLGPQVLSYLAGILHSEADADEVFSQFAEDLWKGLPGFRGESSLRGWAYRVAWHASARFVRDPYRRRGRRLETTEASRIAEEVRSALAPEQAWRTQRVAQLRAMLSREEKALLILRVDRGLSWREVAMALSEEGEEPLTEAALRKRFERLKEKLGKAAKDQGLID